MRHQSTPRRFTGPRALRTAASMRFVFGTSMPCAKNAYSREIVSQASRTSYQTFRSAQALISSLSMDSIFRQAH